MPKMYIDPQMIFYYSKVGSIYINNDIFCDLTIYNIIMIGPPSNHLEVLSYCEVKKFKDIYLKNQSYFNYNCFSFFHY